MEKVTRKFSLCWEKVLVFQWQVELYDFAVNIMNMNDELVFNVTMDEYLKFVAKWLEHPTSIMGWWVQFLRGTLKSFQ